MKINHIYNKSVTCLEPGEVVAERYNGSNAGFAIFKTIELSNGGVVAFTTLKDFKYIDWGDGNITFGPIAHAASHAYLGFEGKKAFTIVVYGIKDFGSKANSNLFSYDNIKEAYFGDGVKIWQNNDSYSAFAPGAMLTTVRNVSDIPEGFCAGQSSLNEVTFNIDCRNIGFEAFVNTCSDSKFQGKCLVIPKYITNIADDAFLSSGFKVCIEYTSPATKPSGYSDDMGTDYYYYSETEPAEAGNYWHYIDGKSTIWGDAIVTIDGASYSFTKGMTWEEWCNNKGYNILGLSVDTKNNYIISSTGQGLLWNTPVSPDAMIQEDASYTLD